MQKTILNMTPQCPADRARAMNGSYITHVTMHGIYLISMIALCIHFLIQEYSHRKDKSIHRSSLVLRLLYLSMLILGILWLTDDLFRFTIDPHTYILRGTIFCKLLAYLVFYIPPCFYALYLIIIVLRLELSFKDSYLALSKRSLYTLCALIFVIPLSATTTLLIDGFDLDCISTWNRSDFDQEITFCVVPSSSLLIFRIYLYESLVGLANILNIVLCIILSIKLRQFIKGANESICAQKRVKLRSLITKNLILTVVGCVSTSLGYGLYAVTGRQECLYTDILANSMIVALFSQRNKSYYKVLCCPCIWLCYKQCNLGKVQVEMRSTLDLQTVMSSSSAVTTPRPVDDLSPK